MTEEVSLRNWNCRRRYPAWRSYLAYGFARGDRFIGSSFQNLIKSPFSTTEKPSSFGDVSDYNNFSELGTDKSDPAKNRIEVFVFFGAKRCSCRFR